MTPEPQMSSSRKPTKFDQGVNVTLDVPRLNVREVVRASVTEAFNEHSTLRTTIRFDGGASVGMQAADAPIQLGFFDGKSYQSLFCGTVQKLCIAGSSMTLTAKGASAARDRTIRTTTYGDALAPTELKKLPGIQSLLRGVGNTSLLERKLAQVWQYGCTDFQLLKRLAASHALLLQIAADGKIAFTTGKESRRAKIPDGWKVPGTERLCVSHEQDCRTEVRTWDRATDSSPDQSARAQENGSSGGGKDSLEQLIDRLFRAGGRNSIAIGILDCEPAAERLADDLARAERSKLVRYCVKLDDRGRDVGVGARIPISANSTKDELLVVRRKLIFHPNSRKPAAQQLLNQIECVPASYPPIATTAPLGGNWVALLGRVTEAVDPKSNCRVKVSFPWHCKKEGIWSLVPQSFAGQANGRHSGAVELPQEEDWVIAFADVTGYAPPIVFRSVYSGTPSKDFPKVRAGERIIFQTASGMQLRISAGESSAPASITLAIVDANGADVSRLTLAADGSVQLHGKDMKFNSDTLGIVAKGQLSGTFNVSSKDKS